MSKVVRLWVRPEGRPKAVEVGGVPRAWLRGDPAGYLVDVEARSAEGARLVLAAHDRAAELGEAGIDQLEDPTEVGELRQALRRVKKVNDGS